MRKEKEEESESKTKQKKTLLVCTFRKRKMKKNETNCQNSIHLFSVFILLSSPRFYLQHTKVGRGRKQEQFLLYRVKNEKTKRKKETKREIVLELLPSLGLPRRGLDLPDVFLDERRDAPPRHPASGPEAVADGLRHRVLAEGSPGPRGRGHGDHAVCVFVQGRE